MGEQIKRWLQDEEEKMKRKVRIQGLPEEGKEEIVGSGINVKVMRASEVLVDFLPCVWTWPTAKKKHFPPKLAFQTTRV